MTFEQGLVYAIIAITLGMLTLQIWRYDLVALIGMLLLVISGTITVDQAFEGFGHPAVVTIAAVLVVSRGLQHTGVTELIASRTLKVGNRLGPQLVVLCGMVVISSAFMNNIAALAILIPVAVRMARRSGNPTSLYLLPMAFSSHFGGLITLIGTPTNLIVSSLRYDYTGVRFGMFEFAPVGLAISIIGVAFIAILGWKVIPKERKGASTNEITMADYVAEMTVPETSPLTGITLRNLGSVTEADIWITAILRDGNRISSPSSSSTIRAGDHLMVRAEASGIEEFVKETGVEITGSKKIEKKNGESEKESMTGWERFKASLASDDVESVEAIVSPGSSTIGKTARELNLRNRYGVNLLGISREDEHLKSSLGQTRLQPNDILLLQAYHEDVPEIMDRLSWLRLAERDIDMQPKNLIIGLAIFITAILLASFDILTVPVAMTSAAVAMVLGGLLSIRDAYLHIEWPIVILLGAMLSLGTALENTGGDQLIANQILIASEFLSPIVILVLILFITMMLSDIVNNAAAVVLMASISVSVARGLGVNTDPFLVAVAIGGACAFLTPIGHEANVLVFEVGGYKFTDYWRLGLPLEILITAVTVPLLLWIWPL